MYTLTNFCTCLQIYLHFFLYISRRILIFTDCSEYLQISIADFYVHSQMLYFSIGILQPETAGTAANLIHLE